MVKYHLNVMALVRTGRVMATTPEIRRLVEVASDMALARMVVGKTSVGTAGGGGGGEGRGLVVAVAVVAAAVIVVVIVVVVCLSVCLSPTSSHHPSEWSHSSREASNEDTHHGGGIHGKVRVRHQVGNGSKTGLVIRGGGGGGGGGGGEGGREGES